MTAHAPATSRARRRLTGRAAALGLAGVVLVLIAAAALAPGVIATHDPLQTALPEALQAPSAEHFFGTDQSGRDIFSRVVYGARVSVGIGVLATATALVVGLMAGLLIGLAPRLVDAAAMRATDVLLAFPEFLLALVVVAVLGPGSVNVAIGVTLAAIPVYVRLARVQTRAAVAAEHVEASRLLGMRRSTTIVRHVLPSVLGTLSVLATIGIGSSIIAAAGLSFLGLGPTEPTPEWGLMLAGGRNVLGQAWWVAVFPGAAITLTVLSAAVIGRAFRARAEGRA